jgi:hypothetical protein
MKCIKAIRATKEVELGEIKRVDNKTAHSMVGYSWQYVSKTEWKLSRGKKVIEEVTDQVTDKVTDKVEKKPYKKGSKPEKKSK